MYSAKQLKANSIAFRDLMENVHSQECVYQIHRVAGPAG